MSDAVLSHRALNRATLARQMLLARSEAGIAETIGRLLGLQAQVTEGPYQALWTRLEGFRHEALTGLIVDRTLARATSLRATLHLHTADDMVGIRALVQPVAERMWQAAFHKRFGGADKAKVIARGRELLDVRPMTGGELGRALAAEFPEAEPQALAVLLQVSDTLVQIPPTRIWGSGHAPLLTRIENWLPPPYERPIPREGLVLRYLAAYGPASVADMQGWSGLTGLRAAFEALRPGLLTFRSEAGRELFDLPEAPRPDPDAPAPVRFMPLYDNVVLGYADRRRMFSEATAARAGMRQDTRPAILVDGAVAAGWEIADRKGRARLAVLPYRRLLKRERVGIESEARAFLAFMRPGAEAREIVFKDEGDA
jgi:hypothetical protein